MKFNDHLWLGATSSRSFVQFDFLLDRQVQIEFAVDLVRTIVDLFKVFDTKKVQNTNTPNLAVGFLGTYLMTWDQILY